MQRTGYLSKDKYSRIFNSLIFRIFRLTGSTSRASQYSMRFQEVFFQKKIHAHYNDDIKLEYQSIKDYLPAKADRVLDIGCGVAGIDVLIANHYNNEVEVYLLDKTGIEEEIFYGFEKSGAFYNSLDISKKVLEGNGLGTASIHLQEATNDNRITFQTEFDVVLSLISWGFHYPISTYLNEVSKKLSPDGVVIVDVRKGSNGQEELKKVFPKCIPILNKAKYTRYLAQKPK